MKKLILKLLLAGTLTTPAITIVSCGSVEGEIKFKIIGLNKNKTDYIFKVTVNKQFIANIIKNNIKDSEKIDQKIKEKILDHIKKCFPKSYKNGLFKKYVPSVQKSKETEYKVLLPIKEIITGLPKYKQVQKHFIDKYKKQEALKEQKETFEDQVFMPDLSSIKDLDDFLSKKYIDKSSDKIENKDYIDFNFMGIKPYMSGKLDDDILKNVLNINKEVKDFLKEKFDGKKEGEKIKLSIKLSGNFELKFFAGKNVDVYFHIKNIEEKTNTSDDKKENEDDEYTSKDKSKPFVSAQNDKADVYFSLFLKKELTPENKVSRTVIVDDKNKIEETSTKKIFSSLKIGKQISRVVEVDLKKPQNQFTYNTANGETEDKFKHIVDAELFKITAKKNNKNLYDSEMLSYKAVMTFDITKIETKDKNAPNGWKTKDINAVIEDGDRVTYTNNKIEYLGLPFDKGESINFKAFNGHSGFIKGFDEQMKNMTTQNQKTITPIFPSDYKEDSLKDTLVKFIIKINDIKKRKEVNIDFLKANKLKDINKEEIETMNDYKFNIENLFKAKIFNEFGEKFLTKAKAEIPFVLVELFYMQTYYQLYFKSKKRPAHKDVLKESEKKAKLNSIIMEFFKLNQIQGDTLEKKRNQFTDEIYKEIKE